MATLVFRICLMLVAISIKYYSLADILPVIVRGDVRSFYCIFLSLLRVRYVILDEQRILFGRLDKLINYHQDTACPSVSDRFISPMQSERRAKTERSGRRPSCFDDELRSEKIASAVLLDVTRLMEFGSFLSWRSAASSGTTSSTLPFGGRCSRLSNIIRTTPPSVDFPAEKPNGRPDFPVVTRSRGILFNLYCQRFFHTRRIDSVHTSVARELIRLIGQARQVEDHRVTHTPVISSLMSTQRAAFQFAERLREMTMILMA